MKHVAIYHLEVDKGELTAAESEAECWPVTCT